MLLLTQGGSLVLIQCNLDHEQHNQIIAEHKHNDDDNITRIYRLDETRTVLLIGEQGTLGTVHVASDAIEPGTSLSMERDESISDVHSITSGDTVYLFVARQCSLEKWSLNIDQSSGRVIIDDDVTRHYRRFDTDCLPFIRVKSFLNHDDTVQATAVSACGRVYLMETNSLGNFYARYGEGETARIDYGVGSSIGTIGRELLL